MFSCDTMAVGGCWCQAVADLSPVSPGNVRASEASLVEPSSFHIDIGFYSASAPEPTSPTTSSPTTSGKLSSRKSLLSAALLRSSTERSASQSRLCCAEGTSPAKTTPAGIFEDEEGCGNLRRNFSAPLFVQPSCSPPINIPTTT